MAAMQDPQKVPVASLRIDPQNPRLINTQGSARDNLIDLVTLLQAKLVKLAEDIAAHGPDGSNLPIIMESGDGDGRYIVLEGNRRLAALRMLENPSQVSEVLSAELQARLKAASQQYSKRAVESLFCLPVNSREEAEHWIRLRHTGENQGAGTVPWGSDESNRFKARGQELEIETQALNLIDEAGLFAPNERRNVPAASFKRLLGTPRLREKCGVQWSNKTLTPIGDVDSAARALHYVANQLRLKHIKTKDIYTADQRNAVADSLPADIIVVADPAKSNGQPAAGRRAIKSQKLARRRQSNERSPLIPLDCRLKVTNPRIARIEQELRTINVRTFPNAASVLLRVFIELSMDTYLRKHPDGQLLDRNTPLAKKLERVRDLLQQAKAITSREAAPVTRALQKSAIGAPSVTMMHLYVHSDLAFPSERDLRDYWHGLQPFMCAVWPA